METQVRSLVSDENDFEGMTREVHQAVGAWIISVTPDDNAEFNELIKRLQQVDSTLARELEAAGNCRTATAMENAFRLGFACARNPEQLLFSRD